MKIKPIQIIAHIVLILGVLLMVVPIWIIFASSTHDNGAIFLPNSGSVFNLKFKNGLDKKWIEIDTNQLS